MLGRYVLAQGLLAVTMARRSPSDCGPKHEAIIDFDEYVRQHDKNYVTGSDEYKMRESLFQRRALEIEELNGRPGRNWTASVNKLTDWTDDELDSLRGYRHRPHDRSANSFSLLSVADANLTRKRWTGNHSWRHRLRATTEIMDQRGCGSCWAFASIATLRAHSQLFRFDRTFSMEQVVSCTPNPDGCGGSGGCDGATVELALEYAAEMGLVTDDEWPYTSSNQDCPVEKTTKSKRILDPNSKKTHFGKSIGLWGYHKLKEGSLAQVLTAVHSLGPVAVSLTAGFKWNMYGGGIMEACPRDTVVNHAVVLIGWGEGPSMKYYHIQNSWGKKWGEDGFLKLQRHEDEVEESYCGWDTSPELGSGCKGGPPKVWVCGTCGILYDTVVPRMMPSKYGLWSFIGEHLPSDGEGNEHSLGAVARAAAASAHDFTDDVTQA